MSREHFLNSPFPLYQSHRQVRAMKIKEVKPTGNGMGGYDLIPVDASLPTVTVGAYFVGKYRVVVGGYYILHEDGWPTYKAAGVIEEGYDLVDSPHVTALDKLLSLPEENYSRLELLVQTQRYLFYVVKKPILSDEEYNQLLTMVRGVLPETSVVFETPVADGGDKRHYPDRAVERALLMDANRELISESLT